MSTNIFLPRKPRVLQRHLALFAGLAAGAALVGCSGASSSSNMSSESEAAAKKQIESAENAEMQRHEAASPSDDTKAE